MKRCRAVLWSHCHLEGLCRPVAGRQVEIPEALGDLSTGRLSDPHVSETVLEGETFRDGASDRSGDQYRRPCEEMPSTGNGDGVATLRVGCAWEHEASCENEQQQWQKGQPSPAIQSSLLHFHPFLLS